jgi:hypothetical protein
MVSRSELDGRFISTVPEIERYFASIDFTAGPGFCNPWAGGTFDSGYPRFSLSDAKRSSVPIPARLVVCHSCDFMICMNPLHWFLGTNAINSADMVAKGRSLPGSRNPIAKLVEADVRVIKYELLPLTRTGGGRAARGQLTMVDIACRYGVTPALIGHIKRGRAWGHV